jgi:excinuclease ABC subunit C
MFFIFGSGSQDSIVRTVKHKHMRTCSGPVRKKFRQGVGVICFEPDSFPSTPGVYLMKDKAGKIIYVGKAKNLRKRVASYFRPSEQLPLKTQAQMSRVEKIDTLQTRTEKEALLLEASLIKKHRPRYNIVLRDDKQYLLFKLDKRSEYPRLTITRKMVRDGSVYFGPFTSAFAARQTLKMVNRVFALRKCNDHVFRNRIRPCLQYDIGRCLGPCVHPVSRDEYAAIVRQVELFLSGKSKDLLSDLHAKMQHASENLAFERAAQYRDLIRAIEKTVEPQAAVLSTGKNLDVVALVGNDYGLVISVLFVRGGKIVDGKQFFWRGIQVDETDRETLVVSFLGQFYGPDTSVPERIVLPFALEDNALEEALSDFRKGAVRVCRAWGQAERSLVAMALANGREFLRKKHKDKKNLNLAKALRLSQEPRRIECIDASHLSGQGMRVGMVVFEDGSPRKNDYRIYAFPELEGDGDDYRALAGFLVRRLEAGPPWPDLLLVDGGKGQLAALERVFKDQGTTGLFPMAAIAKGETRRAGELGDRIFLPGRKNPLPLKPGSPELLYLQKIRDNAHRFVITRQRQSRKRISLDSSLESLPGIGPRMARHLWTHFGSIAAMKQAGVEAIQAVPGIGAKKAAAIVQGLAGLSGEEGTD